MYQLIFPDLTRCHHVIQILMIMLTMHPQVVPQIVPQTVLQMNAHIAPPVVTRPNKMSQPRVLKIVISAPGISKDQSQSVHHQTPTIPNIRKT